jgi:putative ABC transport system ATP-binding protein
MENRRPAELSGGQQQRIAIARAIVGEPKYILADEPTANVDSNTSEQLLHLMLEMNENKGATFIFSTHDPLVMQHAKRLIKLVDGKVVSDETR